jgi:hypothetical protein
MPTTTDAAAEAALLRDPVFASLGEPIQRLLRSIAADVTSDDLHLFSRISVRLLATVYDMLAAGEDAHSVLAHTRRHRDKPTRLELREDSCAADEVWWRQAHYRLDFASAARCGTAWTRMIQGGSQRADAEDLDEREAWYTANPLAHTSVHPCPISQQLQEQADETVGVDESDDTWAEHDWVCGTQHAVAILDDHTGAGGTQPCLDHEPAWWRQCPYRLDFATKGRHGTAWSRMIQGGSQRADAEDLDEREAWYVENPVDKHSERAGDTDVVAQRSVQPDSSAAQRPATLPGIGARPPQMPLSELLLRVRRDDDS